MPQPYTTLIRAGELASALKDPQWVILDVRHELNDAGWGRAAYDRSHIPGAIFVSLSRDLSSIPDGQNGRHPLPTKAQFAETLSGWGVTQGRQVVVYDQGSGMFAARLWWMLRWMGFEACAVLDGGFAQWQSSGGQLCTTPCSAMPAVFVMPPIDAAARPLEVDTAAVQAQLGSGAMMVIDARASSRFRGENETIDPVGGHIPGARNRPFTENLQADGTFKSAAKLRQEFEALLHGTSAEYVVHQCGSGITACHNVLAMEIAGLPGARLYPGSWSAWCADPARPVARGE